uniref:Prostaglandin reductase 1 n=1 Tax=Culicoides sonorensis TaxID=179676 RepID=A0A336MUL9_CULSO
MPTHAYTQNSSYTIHTKIIMTIIKGKKIVLKSHFDGLPKVSDFEIVEETINPIKNGEILVQAEYLSVDPYMRSRAATLSLGSTLFGGQVAKVVDSKNPRYPIGVYLFGYFGWRTHSIVNPEEMDSKPYVLPDFGNLPRSLAIGAVGMPGNTAYFGLLEICQPKAGETLVVSGAAGAVGSLVGQIAKLKGLKTIGIAGSDDKCEWLTQKLGFDHAINYKTTNVGEELKKVAPNGVDCYFDNIGGELSATIIQNMNSFGRIAVCGSISVYNKKVEEYPKIPDMQKLFNWKQLRMEGFIVNRWANRWMEGLSQMLEWIKQGHIKYEETVTTGFENMPTAFIEMLTGKNFGKAVIKV